MPRLSWVTMSYQTLSVVRVAFYSVALLEWLQLYYVRAISFALPDPYASVLLWILLIATLAMIAGYRLSFTAPLNYVLVLYVQQFVIDHYHVDHFHVGVALTFLFATPPRFVRPGDKVPQWVFALFFLQLWLVYFDSIFYKYQCVSWLEGTIFWLASALPPFSYGNFPDVLESEVLIRGLTYLALGLETLFPLILLRPFCYVLWPIGVGLHLGIALLFPIPLFALAVGSLYLIFVDFSRLSAWFPRLRAESSDRMQGPTPNLALMLVAGLFVSQLLLITARFYPDARRLQWLYIANALSTTFTGLSDNNVYIDDHFRFPAPFLRFEMIQDNGDRVAIPTFDEKSYPQVPFVTGRIWALQGFYMRYGSLQFAQKAWLRYLLGYCKLRGIQVRNIRAKVQYHKLAPLPLGSFDFQADDRIEAEGWKDAGEIVFDAAGRPRFEWRPDFVALYR